MFMSYYFKNNPASLNCKMQFKIKVGKGIFKLIKNEREIYK